MRFSRSIDIEAAPEVVWGVWSDIERWSEWTASITSIEKLSPGPLVVGMRARVLQPKLPAAIWRVTEVQQSRGFTWVSTSPGAHVTGIHTIEPQAGGTRATMTLIFNGPVALVFGWLMRSLSEGYLKIEGEGLKARSEAHARSRKQAAPHLDSQLPA